MSFNVRQRWFLCLSVDGHRKVYLEIEVSTDGNIRVAPTDPLRENQSLYIHVSDMKSEDP